MRIGGAIGVFTQGNPAAGADFSFTFPAGVHHLLDVAAVLVTSATVANRGVKFQLQDAAGNVLGTWGANFAHAASLTLNYSAPATIAGQTDPNGNFGAIVVPMPDSIQVVAGWKLLSLTSNIQVGDQWSAIHFGLEQFLQ